MELNNNENLQVNNNELVTEQEQNTFLESTLGKVINSALDVGIRMILPDFIEEGVIGIKDSLMQGGLKEGVDTGDFYWEI